MRDETNAVAGAERGTSPGQARPAFSLLAWAIVGAILADFALFYGWRK
jgi:hypothetical protein